MRKAAIAFLLLCTFLLGACMRLDYKDKDEDKDDSKVEDTVKEDQKGSEDTEDKQPPPPEQTPPPLPAPPDVDPVPTPPPTPDPAPKPQPDGSDQPLEFSEQILQTVPEATLAEIQRALNGLGDPPKGTITFNGFYVYEELLGSGTFQVDVFVRNGFDYPVSNINGDVLVTVKKKNAAGQEEDIEVAKAYFDVSFLETIQPGSTKVATLIFYPEAVLVDNLTELDFSMYYLHTNMYYNY